MEAGTGTLSPTARVAGRPQAAVLLACICFPVMATSLLGPVLPAMERHFADVPRVETLVPVMLTVAILALAIFSPIAGAACDRFGRKRLLTASLALYGLAGSAPLYLESLHAIIATRVLVGVAEAGIVACSCALIGDYFSGRQLDRTLALQSTVASLSAFAFNLAGGVLGEGGWRVPFVAYLLAFAMLVVVSMAIWETRGDRSDRTLALDGAATDVAFRPRLLAWICAVALVGGATFIMVPVHLSYLLVDQGVTSPSRIGTAYAANSVGVAAGTLLFGWFLAGRWRVAAQMALCFALAAAGFVVMATNRDYMTTLLGGVLNGVGCGIVLPMLLTWTIRELPAARRGIGLGAFFSCYFVGSFVNPLVVIPLGAALGSRGLAVEAWGYALVVAAAAATILSATGRRAEATAPRA